MCSGELGNLGCIEVSKLRRPRRISGRQRGERACWPPGMLHWEVKARNATQCLPSSSLFSKPSKRHCTDVMLQGHILHKRGVLSCLLSPVSSCTSTCTYTHVSRCTSTSSSVECCNAFRLHSRHRMVNTRHAAQMIPTSSSQRAVKGGSVFHIRASSSQ